MALRAAQEASRFEAVRVERFGLPPTPQPPALLHGVTAAAGSGGTAGMGPGSEALQRAMEELGGRLVSQQGGANRPQQLPWGAEAVTACRRHLASLQNDDATLSQLDLVLLDYGRLLAVQWHNGGGTGGHSRSSGSSNGPPPRSIQDLICKIQSSAPFTCAHLAASAAGALAAHSRQHQHHQQQQGVALPQVSDILRLSDVPVLLAEYRRLVEAAG
jgi:hypothetical protein